MQGPNFYLHNFDTWQVKRQARVNEHDLGRRARGNIQIHRLSADGGLLVWVDFAGADHFGKAASFYMEGLPFREAYKTGWRLKRLMDRYW